MKDWLPTTRNATPSKPGLLGPDGSGLQDRTRRLQEEPAIARKTAESASLSAGPELFLAVYDELRSLARRYLARERRNHTLQPTALVHEAWFKLRRERRVDWNGRTHVLAVGAQAMRRLLVDHGRGRKRVKRGGGQAATTLHDWLDAGHDSQVSVEDALALHDVLTRLATVDARQASIVEMRYFGGLTVPEVADALGVSVRTVEGEWTHARAWLHRALSSPPP